MKKFIFAFIFSAMTLVCGCGKDNGSGNEPVIDPVETISWDKLLKAYPFLDGFPVFDGNVENYQYKDIAGMKTVTFFDYKCDESVAKTYYAKFVAAGFTKSEGSQIYRKTVDKTEYTFSGSYGGGNFALSFSVDSK